MSAEQSRRELQVALARSMVDEAAPEEAPYFDDIVASEHAAQKKSGDHELGFGVPIDVNTASAAILVLSGTILNFMLETARDAAGSFVKDATEQVRVAFEKKLFAWFKGRFQKPSPVLIAPEECSQLIAMVERDAQAMKLEQDVITRLVATLRSSLEH